jgi:alanyl-tRNA synthetase
MKTDKLRQIFLQYFKAKEHELVSSGSLVPAEDPTLLFTNAGMNQFKDVFLGKEKRSYVRAASVQKCMRAGGKHNDLENVGFTARHHTFFEMLGNFSFGDYFKREAIQYAWEFLTETLKIPAAKLWITVYEQDDEAENIWLKEIGVDPERFSRCGAKDNFWAMGDIGPCGPCSEIFYDHGPSIPGGPPGTPEEEGDRYVEIWNLVFMQYERDVAGKLTPLPKPSVDTGMGLERIAAVMQGVHSNYAIDIFKELILAAAKLTGCKDLTDPGLKVLADHIRACAFLIAEGVMPSNEGRGYVLRRIIRRAVRNGNKLGIKKPFFYKMLPALIKVMGECYPELTRSEKMIENVLFQEEEQFAVTLAEGMKVLEKSIIALKDKVIPGEVVFKLYDTYGFPLDLTEVIAKERGFSIDEQGFKGEMRKQKERAKAAGKFESEYKAFFDTDHYTEFVGYNELSCEARVVDWLPAPQDSVEKGLVVLILDRTPFYVASGGQTSDKGTIENKECKYRVDAVMKTEHAILHYGVFKRGSLKAGDAVTAKVDSHNRLAITLNHSATHLLQAALRQVLGEHVIQKGSFVDADRLRFDFTHFKRGVTSDELKQTEQLVNQQIQADLPVKTKTMSIEEAKATGATALFGEKYGEEVRVVQMGDFSIELCGGTHVKHTGEIKQFKITSESGIAAGIRRIEAVTGNQVTVFEKEEKVREQQEKNKLKLKQDQKEKEKMLKQQKNKSASEKANELLNTAEEINGIKLITYEGEGAGMDGLRILLDQLKSKLAKAIIVLADVDGSTVKLVVGVTKDNLERFHAGEIIKQLCQQLGGKGGGRPDMAQGGGNKSENLMQVLTTVKKIIKKT